MATGTIAPVIKHQFFTSTGAVAAGHRLYTFEAGTTTPLPVYTDAALLVPHANPVVLDAAGRATLYLANDSYKFILTDASDVHVWTQDLVSAIAPYNVDLDIDGVAGETLPMGSAVYLANGTSGTTAGRWYLADASATATSSAASMVAMVPADVTSGATGSVRIQGRMTGLTGLTPGAPHYVSETAGQITVTPPTYQRLVGVADSTTTLVLFGAAVGNVITVSGIDFVALESENGPGDIIATIRASTEADGTGGLLKISANKITLGGLTTFESGYDPTSKVAVDLTNAPAGILNSSVTPGTLGVPTTSEAMLKAMYLTSGGAGGITTIDGGLITTGSIAAEDIAAGTITGWTVQTGSSGARVVLKNTTPQLAWYNASGSLIGTINDDTFTIALAPNAYADPNGLLIGTAATGVRLRGYVPDPPGFLWGTHGELAVDGGEAELVLRAGTRAVTISPSGIAISGGGLSVAGAVTPTTDGTVSLGAAGTRWATAHFDLTANTAPAYVVVNDPSDASAIGYCIGETRSVTISGTTLTFTAGLLTGVA